MIRCLAGSVLVFAAAAQAANPSPRVTLVVEASTWRENRKPYDIRTDITKKLNAAGVTVVKEGAPADGELTVTWDEAEGQEFVELGREDGPKRTATEISFDVSLWVGTNDTLSFSVNGEPDVVAHGDLYGVAMGIVKDNDLYVHSGHLVAAALGRTASLPKLLPMLCTEDSETADVAKKLLADQGFTPTTPGEEVYVAWGAGEMDRIREIGKKGIPQLLACAERAEPIYPNIDEELMTLFADIGDARATPFLLAELNVSDFLNTMSSPEMGWEDADVPGELLTVIAALGSAGDSRALAMLDRLSGKKKFPTLANAAKDAAKKIRSRGK